MKARPSTHSLLTFNIFNKIKSYKMGEGEDERPPEFDAIVESTGLDGDQVM